MLLPLQDEVMAGELSAEDFESGAAREAVQKAKLAEIEDERKRMAADRASLPIYPYRWGTVLVADCVVARQLPCYCSRTPELASCTITQCPYDNQATGGPYTSSLNKG
jgi:hypothetical protein